MPAHIDISPAGGVSMDMLTDRTPGNALNRAWISSRSARSRSRENAGPADTFTTST